MNLSMGILAFVLVHGGSSNVADCQKEQLAFAANDETVQCPAKIPQPVMQVLKQDRVVLDTLQSEGLSSDQLPTSWLVASEIHLDGTSEKHLVIIGVGKLRGAHIVSFWVFRSSSKGAELLLADRADVLKVTNHWSHGYKNIEITSLTAVSAHTALFKFDGKRYRLFSTKDERL